MHFFLCIATSALNAEKNKHAARCGPRCSTYLKKKPELSATQLDGHCSHPNLLIRQGAHSSVMAIGVHLNNAGFQSEY